MDRNIQYYKNYFIDFYNALDSATQRKLAYVIQYVKTETRWNEKFVKFIRDGLFELRAMHNGNIYRVFFILDEGNIIILFNGFQKKTQKTPKQEALAKQIGTNKSYISKIENGLVEPSASLFLRILSSLGLRFDIVKPLVQL